MLLAAALASQIEWSDAGTDLGKGPSNKREHPQSQIHDGCCIGVSSGTLYMGIRTGSLVVVFRALDLGR